MDIKGFLGKEIFKVDGLTATVGVLLLVAVVIWFVYNSG